MQPVAQPEQLGRFLFFWEWLEFSFIFYALVLDKCCLLTREARSGDRPQQEFVTYPNLSIKRGTASLLAERVKEGDVRGFCHAR